MMDLLGITALRPGVAQNGQGAHPVNWDESKANPWPNLPNPLIFNNGKPVRTAKDWTAKRRPELVELFDREILGRVPANVPAVHWQVVSTTPGTEDGIATITKHLVGHVDNSADPAIAVDIQADLILPAAAPGTNQRQPVPVVVEITFDRPLGSPPPPPRPARPAPPASATAAPNPARAGSSAAPPGPSPKQQTLARGWAFALLYPTSFQADNGGGLTQGIIGLVNHGQFRKPDDWGALRAWAWGASRLVDYFQTDPSVDAHHIAVEGHSRFGKAALVTMAYDPRFTVAYINSSGAGGANLARRRFGEQLENIAGAGESHWMGGNYIKYAGPESPPPTCPSTCTNSSPSAPPALSSSAEAPPKAATAGPTSAAPSWPSSPPLPSTPSSAKSRSATPLAPSKNSRPSAPPSSPATSPSASIPTATILNPTSPPSSTSPPATCPPPSNRKPRREF